MYNYHLQEYKTLFLLPILFCFSKSPIFPPLQRLNKQKLAYKRAKIEKAQAQILKVIPFFLNFVLVHNVFLFILFVNYILNLYKEDKNRIKILNDAKDFVV